MSYAAIARYQWLRKLFFRPVITGLHEDESFVMDHLHFEAAKLVNCELIYGGGPLCMNDTRLDGCSSLRTFGKASACLEWIKLFDCENNTVIQSTFPYTFRKLLQSKEEKPKFLDTRDFLLPDGSIDMATAQTVAIREKLPLMIHAGRWEP